MKAIKNFFLFAVLLSTATVTFAQGVVSGTVVDGEENLPLPGASVMIKGTSNGTTTDFDGKFQLNAEAASGTVIVSYVGFESAEVAFTSAGDLGTITLQPGNELDEVVVVGVADIAKERETPVAVSTIRASEIIEKLGNQELPELLNSTPSVYATKSGGGYGDSRINIRGFDQRNTAVLINGVPVNDMENGAVFWSNWTGLADVASAMQVQRGLGSSKLAISSVGGTLNIVTKTTDRREGGFVGTTFGNDNYLKTIASYSTGRNEKNGLAFTFLMSRTAGDGYINGTEFEGYNYFFGAGWSDDENKHSVQFTLTGAPQVHNQRTTSFFNTATLEQYLQFGDKYNFNHGFLNGKEFNWRQNFYHKPVASINWDWNVNEKSKLSTVLYASYGRGGGTGDLGRFRGRFASDPIFRDANGLVRWDAIAAAQSGVPTQFADYGGSGLFGQNDSFTFNTGADFQTGTQIVNDADLFSSSTSTSPDALDGVERRNGFIRRASVNSHNWFGLLSNFNHQLNDNFTIDFGIDLRTYKGFHYRRIDNLLGADGYRDNDNVNAPFNILSETYGSNFSSIVNVFRDIDDEEKIDYYNIGNVRWAGVFGQVEYKNDNISSFVQFGASNQGFQREDLFNNLDSDPAQLTDWENILGGNIKAGINWNIDEQNNLFANAGYYSKQPLFDAVFINFQNDLNPDIRNEKVLGTEIGYGFRTEEFTANFNLYRTSWKDRFSTLSKTYDTQGDGTRNDNTDGDDSDDIQGIANIRGIEQVHMGAELEATYKPATFISFRGMVSYGLWEYAGNPSGEVLGAQDQQPIIDLTTGLPFPNEVLFLDNVKVGDAAQFTSRLSTIIEPVERLKFDIGWFRADNLFASINAEDFDRVDNDGSLQLPAYNLWDAGMSYKMLVGKNKQNSVSFRVNVNNLFNTTYIAESLTNTFGNDSSTRFNGIDVRNKAFFGFGRTWNMSLRYSF